MKEMSYTRDEYVQKKYFLENYFILQFHYLPTWYESTRFKEMYQMLKIQFPYRCDVCRCYVDSILYLNGEDVHVWQVVTA